MCLCQRIICQTTSLWVGERFPLKGMDVLTVSHPGKGHYWVRGKGLEQAALRLNLKKHFLLFLPQDLI